MNFEVTEVELPDENANAGVPENVHEEKKNTEATMKRGRTGKKGRTNFHIFFSARKYFTSEIIIFSHR